MRIANIIFGQARKTLEGMGHNFDSAIPSIVTGIDHCIDHNSLLPVIVIPFTTDLGQFKVEICSSSA